MISKICVIGIQVDRWVVRETRPGEAREKQIVNTSEKPIVVCSCDRRSRINSFNSFPQVRIIGVVLSKAQISVATPVHFLSR